MIIFEEDEESPVLLRQSLQYTPKTYNKIQLVPSQYTRSNIIIGAQMVDAMSTIADEIKSDIYHKTVGYGLVAVGAGVLVSTRGVGWKPAAIIMSTGMNNLAEVN